MKVESESEVAQSCLTLRDTMDCSLPGFSVHEIFQARVLEWGATAFSVLRKTPGKLTWESEACAWEGDCAEVGVASGHRRP